MTEFSVVEYSKLTSKELISLLYLRKLTFKMGINELVNRLLPIAAINIRLTKVTYVLLSH